MLLLPGAAPTSADLLAQTIHALLTGAVAVSRDRVVATGDFPRIDLLALDLTGAVPGKHVSGDVVEPSAGQSGISTAMVGRLSVVGKPFGPPDRPATVDVSARDLKLEFVQVTGRRTAMRLAGVADGKLSAHIALETIRTALIAEATTAAKAQGVTIKDAKITWSTPDQHTLAVEAEIDAKKGFFPATVIVSGQVSIDSTLTAKLSNLAVDGKGMGGTIGAGLLRPRLAKYEGTTYSLMALPLDAIKVTDVRFTAGKDRLGVEAEFSG